MEDQGTIKSDYKVQLSTVQNPQPRAHRHLILVAAGLIVLGITLGTLPDAAKANRSQYIVEPAVLPQPDANAAITEAGESSSPNLPVLNTDIHTDKSTTSTGQNWHKVTVKTGDSLSRIFDRLNITPQELHKLLSLGGHTKELTRLYPGNELRLNLADNGQLQHLFYDIDELRTVHVNRNSNGLTASMIERHPERRTNQANGTIDSSLFLAAQKSQLSDKLTMELAGIFGWDIDFVLDIRKGDSFTVIYDELYLNGEKLRDGNIIAAEFINRGKSYRAVRYTDSNNRTDYYNPKGNSMRKEFLRTPVDFTRISSRFSTGRKHPVLNKIRAHKGVDYAAPRGTPVKATGDGKVIHSARKGGYGKAVIIQHGTRYNTLYAHLNSYARGIRNGKRVKQGQVIGYVGSTGLATGPHLHYEFRVNGVHRNPLTVRLPDAAPLQKKHMADFNNKAQPLFAQLDLLQRIAATNQTTNDTFAFNSP